MLRTCVTVAAAIWLGSPLLLGVAAEAKAVVPFVDGMTITTKNTVDTVEVRARSQGPGFCAAEFSAFGGHIGLLAPPFKYSSWHILTSHIGAVTLTIHDDVKCDSGILAQVRY